MWPFGDFSLYFHLVYVPVSPRILQVWPKGKVVFPDYFKNVTRQVWKDLIVKHRVKLVFDALWIVSPYYKYMPSLSITRGW